MSCCGTLARRWSVRGRRRWRWERIDGAGLPFLATMFHAVGLNVMDARESKRDILEASRRALRDMLRRGQQYSVAGISHGPRIHGVFSPHCVPTSTETCVEQADCDKHSLRRGRFSVQALRSIDLRESCPPTSPIRSHSVTHETPLLETWKASVTSSAQQKALLRAEILIGTSTTSSQLPLRALTTVRLLSTSE